MQQWREWLTRWPVWEKGEGVWSLLSPSRVCPQTPRGLPPSPPHRHLSTFSKCFPSDLHPWAFRKHLIQTRPRHPWSPALSGCFFPWSTEHWGPCFPQKLHGLITIYLPSRSCIYGNLGFSPVFAYTCEAFQRPCSKPHTALVFCDQELFSFMCFLLLGFITRLVMIAINH